MAALTDKSIAVIGGSRGLGRVIVGAAHAEGARVLAIARQPGPLAQLAGELPGVDTLTIDATDDDAPAKVFGRLKPDVLVLCGGAPRTIAPLPELDWRDFTRIWDNDVKSSFLFCKAALLLPLPVGATIILISSGAALGGSPISGGYAGAKRMQMFMANYCQRESERRKLGLRFLALVPARPMPDTEGGMAAVEGYAKYLGLSVEEHVKRMDKPQTAQDVANAVVSFSGDARPGQGNVFLVSAKGVETVT
jgi:NAD(P)-dependent dehydrogenase (short-subunit alcohol dehydrogenase family)